MSQQNIQIFLYAIGAISIVLFIWNIFLQKSLLQIKKKQAILFQGKKGKDLEEVIIQNKKRIDDIDEDVKDLYEITTKINQLADWGIHKTGVVRFNPFRDIGGDQSFSVALLDGKNNGLVISSLYSREGVRVYAKAISNGASEKYPLTQEEKHAISIASPEKNNQKNKRVL